MLSLNQLLPLLQCPACGGELRIGQLSLDCTDCTKAYPMADGLVSFARDSDAGFDERWRKHPAPQPTTIEQWVAKTGIKLSDLRGKTVLDAGCGIGRYSAFVAGHGADAIGVDISLSGLTAAQENAPDASLLQADLLHLPLRDASVDIAFSIGVLHHLPSTREGFAEVARAVKPGGCFAVWVYSGVPPEIDPKWAPYNDFLHEVTRSLPPEALYDIVSRHAVKIRDAYQPEWGPVHQLMRPAYNPSDEQCISDMFDWHTPRYRWYHTYDEVKGWFAECGFDVVWEGSFPVSVRGVKWG